MHDLTQLRVLLVEDNALDARAMLRALGMITDTVFEITHVEDLASALERLGNEPFDCVLLDLSLPDSKGLLAVDAVVERAPHAPVVVLTGLDDPRTAVDAVNRGAHDYIQKGRADGDVVARSIRYAVARHHSEVTLRATSEQLRVAHDRGRIARDLHDTVVQQLFATGMALHALAGTTTDLGARDTLVSAVDQIDTAIRQLREAIFDLHIDSPDHDEDHELDVAIRAQRDALGFRPSIAKHNIDELDRTLLHEVVSVVSEALSNIAKHAKATSAKVSVSVDDGLVTAEVIDNGTGMVEAALSRETSTFTGHGLKNMAARAHALGGHFSVHPGPGGGTRLTWRVPTTPVS